MSSAHQIVRLAVVSVVVVSAATLRVRADSPSEAPSDADRGTKQRSKPTITYSTDIAIILERKCQTCHRPGQVGPFSLLTYEQTRKHARMIAEVVEERRMPPWHADSRFGKFSNDRSLTEQERATLLAWVKAGAPEGDPSKTPAPKTFAEGWTIGKPDVVLTMPEPYQVAAEGTLPYQYFRVKTNFKDDVWVQAAEARPGERSVVHHILVQVDGEKESPIGTSDAHGYLTVYVPGDAPSIFPPGTAKRIPAGADIVFQMHYTPTGTPKTDRSSLALIFAKTKPQFEAITYGIAQARFEIPAGAPDTKVESNFTVPKDIRLVSLFPHMHLRGKRFSYAAVFADGTRETLLSVPAYDFAWQSVYRLAEPKLLPRGTRIECEAHFDNSASNPANPDATKAVRWGPQTYEEMMIGYVDFADVVADKEKEVKKAPRTGPFEKPLGNWKSTRGGGTATLRFQESTLGILIEAPNGHEIELTAEYRLSSFGVVYGVIRELTKGRGPVAGDVFSFSFDKEGTSLTISGWKGSGVMARGTLLNGAYQKTP